MDRLVRDSLLSIFRGKRVLVTGDTGFKGSWLCLWLHELGAQVVGFALPPERDYDHFSLLHLDRMIHHITGDIRDFGSFLQVLQEFQPEFLFHLAAQPLVRVSYENPRSTFDTNVTGSVNILEATRLTPSLRALIYVTSDKCYKNKEWVWGYRENDELGGHDPYSSSKAAAELAFSSYSDSFFSKRDRFGAASVRAGNVIGGGDWSADRIVPDTIRSLNNKCPVLLRNPKATRPWQHVTSPLFGYLLTAAKLYENPKLYSGSWNFGPDGDSMRTVTELVKKILTFWGGGKTRAVEQKDASYEAGLLHLNCDKAHQLLDWFPRWNFDQSVFETVRWYKEIGAGKPAVEISRQQIINYMESL